MRRCYGIQQLSRSLLLLVHFIFRVIRLWFIAHTGKHISEQLEEGLGFVEPIKFFIMLCIFRLVMRFGHYSSF